jgi:adenylate cyclase class 2
MREIEVKAQLRDKETFLKNAHQMGIKFGDAVVHEDTTYESTMAYDDPQWNIFRIRKQGDKTILTMKYKASLRSRDNHERETIVEDAGQVADMLERVGYSLGVYLRKSRRTAHYNGLELCLDEIEGLGTFVEVEKLAGENADVDAVQTQLWNLLQELGIKPDDRVHKGYDTLMHEHLNY